MNILDLTEQDGLNLKRVAPTRGGEYKGPCPWCSGTDRFTAWPDLPNKNGVYHGGRYICRQCQRHGDALQYLVDRRGLSYPEACAALGVEAGERLNNYVKPAFEPREGRIPSEKWREKAGSFLSWAQSQLRGDPGALDYLRGRGLSDDSIKAAGLGWNPKEFFLDRESFGLEPELNDRGKPKKVWLPVGLTIPLWTDGKLSRIRFRRPNVEGGKYVYLTGSCTGPMTWGPDRDVFLVVEAELDGLLVHQEAGGLVGAVALGAANYRPDKTTHQVLKRAELVLIALDGDRAGQKESWGFWVETYQAKRCPPIRGKDPSEMHQNGVSIPAWIRAALGHYGHPAPFPKDWFNRFNETELERLAIMTIDGGLSDEEALKALTNP